ncbi:MAG: efflux RND transporter permease subunit, partial [Bdellovibrionia bacterium]
GTRAELTAKIYGDDLGTLMELTHGLAKTLKTLPDSGEVFPELKGSLPLLQIRPKLDVLAQYSLSAAPVLDAISIGMAGQETGYYYEGLRRIPLVVKLSESLRNDPRGLRLLQVSVGDPLTVSLDQVAEFERTQSLAPILREDSQRRSAVLINPRTRDIQSFVKQAQSTIAQTLTLPHGYRIQWFGSFKNLSDAKLRLSLLAPLALLLVAAMIYWAFESLVETCIVLATVPLALAGGVFALVITQIPFSISAAVGFIALLGIAVLNGVVLVHTFHDLREKQRDPHWVTHGASLRLRPVLMTAWVDIFGFIPMALSQGVGSEVQKPLATVVIGGIFTSTLLTLVVLPVVSARLLKKDQKQTA